MISIRRKSYLEFQIAEVDRELKAVAREIRLQERIERKRRRLDGYGRFSRRRVEDREGEQAEVDGRRLASFLGAGSVQTIAHAKFRSDLVRRRRLLIGAGVIAVLAAAWIIWKLVL